MEIMTTLFLIRHGETIANRLDYIQGTLDNEMTRLTADGISEAESYQPLLANNHIDCVYSSPLKRAVKTSQIICAQSGLPVKVDPRLVEISYGQWNGMAIRKLKQLYANYFDNVTNDVQPNSIIISNGESFSRARDRIQSFLNDVAIKHPQKTVLIVTHGWVIKNIISLCLDNIDGTVFNNPHNLSISKVEIDDDSRKQRVCYYNCAYKKMDVPWVYLLL